MTWTSIQHHHEQFNTQDYLRRLYMHPEALRPLTYRLAMWMAEHCTYRCFYETNRVLGELFGVDPRSVQRAKHQLKAIGFCRQLADSEMKQDTTKGRSFPKPPQGVLVMVNPEVSTKKAKRDKNAKPVDQLKALLGNEDVDPDELLNEVIDRWGRDDDEMVEIGWDFGS